MSVAAPTQRLSFGTTTERVRAGVACPRCRATSDPGEPFCAHCGARVVVMRAGKAPADVAATRSLQFAALVVAANTVIGVLTFGVVFLVSDAARLIEAALFLEGIKLLVVGVLATTAIRFGVRGIRDTAAGGLRGRGRAIGGIVIASIFALLVLLSFAAVLVMYLAL
jgi:DNA-directed RNA polymerase subunit RPC12/RpoP